MDDLRTCPKCKQTKPLTEFKPYIRSGKIKYCWCYTCSRESYRKYYQKNRTKEIDRKKIYSRNIWAGTSIKALELKGRRKATMRIYDKIRYKNMPESEKIKRREYLKHRRESSEYKLAHYTDYLKRTYDLSLEEYNKLLADQGGVCAICGLPPTTRRLAVDHNHKTGEIRGLLCYNCNVSLGLMKDSPDLLTKALAYLMENAL